MGTGERSKCEWNKGKLQRNKVKFGHIGNRQKKQFSKRREERLAMEQRKGLQCKDATRGTWQASRWILDPFFNTLLSFYKQRNRWQ